MQPTLAAIYLSSHQNLTKGKCCWEIMQWFHSLFDPLRTFAAFYWELSSFKQQSADEKLSLFYSNIDFHLTRISSAALSDFPSLRLRSQIARALRRLWKRNVIIKNHGMDVLIDVLTCSSTFVTLAFLMRMIYVPRRSSRIPTLSRRVNCIPAQRLCQK